MATVYCKETCEDVALPQPTAPSRALQCVPCPSARSQRPFPPNPCTAARPMLLLYVVGGGLAVVAVALAVVAVVGQAESAGRGR